MVRWVYENATNAKGVDEVCVATDDQRIFDAVKSFGGNVLMTSSKCVSGTDRVAEVSQKISADYYINIQGDEPLLESSHLESALNVVVQKGFDIGTLMAPINAEELTSVSTVKVVTDLSGKALYFSRAALKGAKKHIGVYVYSHSLLNQFCNLPVSYLEEKESLEQLRAIENGYSIGAAFVNTQAFGVDTPEDLKKVILKFDELEIK